MKILGVNRHPERSEGSRKRDTTGFFGRYAPSEGQTNIQRILRRHYISPQNDSKI